MKFDSVIISLARCGSESGFMVEMHDVKDGSAEFRRCATSLDVRRLISPYVRNAEKVTDQLIGLAA